MDYDGDTSRISLLKVLVKYSYRCMPEGQEFTLASGEKSQHYVDVRRTALRAQGANLLAYNIYDLIAHGIFGGINGVAGVALGGCPLATATSMYALSDQRNLDVIYVRKEAKTHGSKRLVEHPYEDEYVKGKAFVLLEDVVTTGDSVAFAIVELEKLGIDVRGVIAVVDRRPTSSTHLGGKQFRALTTLAEIIETSKSA